MVGRHSRKRTILTFSSPCPSWAWWSPLLAVLGSARALRQSFSVWTCWARRRATSSSPPASFSRPGEASSSGQISHAATGARRKTELRRVGSDRGLAGARTAAAGPVPLSLPPWVQPPSPWLSEQTFASSLLLSSAVPPWTRSSWLRRSLGGWKEKGTTAVTVLCIHYPLVHMRNIHT